MAKAPELNVTVGLDAATRMLGEIANRVDEIREYISEQLQPFALATFPEQRWAFIIRGKGGRSSAMSFKAASVMDAYLLFMAEGGPADLAGEDSTLVGICRVEPVGDDRLREAVVVKLLSEDQAKRIYLEHAGRSIERTDQGDELLTPAAAAAAMLTMLRNIGLLVGSKSEPFSGPGGPEKDPLVSLGQGEYRQDYPPKPPAVGTHLDTQA